jgi:transposase
MRSPTEIRGSKSQHVVCLVLSEWVEQYLWFVVWNEAVCESLVMDLSMEQWLAIKFCFKAGKSSTETLQMVNVAYEDQVLSLSNVFRWYGQFRDGWEDIEDVPSSGRPTECRNNNMVEKISQFLLQNRHLSLRMLADEVNIGKDTV